MDCPSFDGFHAQLGCKLTCGNKKSKTAITRVAYIVSCSKTRQKKNRTHEKYSQNGIAIKIQNNHNGVRVLS